MCRKLIWRSFFFSTMISVSVNSYACILVLDTVTAETAGLAYHTYWKSGGPQNSFTEKLQALRQASLALQ